MKSQDKTKYVVKYLGIVEGTIGCLTRKMEIPTKQPDYPAGFIPSTKRINQFKVNARHITQPVLRKQYTSKNTTQNYNQNNQDDIGTLGDLTKD